VTFIINSTCWQILWLMVLFCVVPTIILSFCVPNTRNGDSLFSSLSTWESRWFSPNDTPHDSQSSPKQTVRRKIAYKYSESNMEYSDQESLLDEPEFEIPRLQMELKNFPVYQFHMIYRFYLLLYKGRHRVWQLGIFVEWAFWIETSVGNPPRYY
jgi:hypothetical protein